MPRHDIVIDDAVMRLLKILLPYVTSLLDLGCGYGWFALRIRTELEPGNKVYLIGCDIYEPYLMKIKDFGLYDDLIVCDVRIAPFRTKSVDLILATDLIEHMEKREGIKLLKDITDIGRKAIIVSTPLGFKPQESKHGNPWEEHKSAWNVEDFTLRSFKVHVVRRTNYKLMMLLKLIHKILRSLNIKTLNNLVEEFIVAVKILGHQEGKE